MLPASVASLFWEIDVASLDVARHRDYVLERVMTRGGWDAMRWLRRTYPVEVIADFLARKGNRLPPRERAFWSLVAGSPTTGGRGGGRPDWAGRDTDP